MTFAERLPSGLVGVTTRDKRTGVWRTHVLFALGREAGVTARCDDADPRSLVLSCSWPRCGYPLPRMLRVRFTYSHHTKYFNIIAMGCQTFARSLGNGFLPKHIPSSAFEEVALQARA